MMDQLVAGSAPKMVGQEVRGLSDLGYRAEALVIKSGYSPIYSYHLAGVKIESISDMAPPVSVLDLKFPGFSFFSLHHLTSAAVSPLLFKQGRWDIIVCLAAYTCFTAQALKKSRGIPYLAFIGTEPFTYILPKVYSGKPLGRLLPFLMPFAGFLQEYILRDCEAVITFSKTYDHLIREYSSKPIETLPAGCFPIESLPDKREKFILTFDRWDIGNTPHIFLEILPKIDRDIKLVVAGHWYPESIRTSFIAEVKRKNLEDRISILGPLNELDIIRLCSSAMIHVHTNKEAFGMQSLEAAACGCPIIVPKGSGVTELFQDGLHGFFPEEGDIGGITDAINRISSDPLLAWKLGFEAWQVAKRNTWKEHAQRLSRIIERYS
jgi:glycosyltransferase involved in cell wall biosynthesis